VRNLRRRLSEQIKLRWAVVVISAIGGGLSIALNVEHAPDNLWARLTGAWPPIAVVVTVELVSRIPATNILLAIGRILVTVGVGGGAFYVSFIQQYDFMLRIGWSGMSAWIFPLITDGVVVVALLSMIEVVRAIRSLRMSLDEIEVAEIEVAEAALLASKAAETPQTPVVDTTTPVAPEPEPAPVAVEPEPEPVNDDKPKQPTRRRPRASTPSTGVKRDERPAITATVIDAVVMEPVRDLVS
jgi:hypothetical protein